MEFFNILTNIGLVLFILFFFYFIYTLNVLATKQSVAYIKAKCPDYWNYNQDTGMCSYGDETILLSDYLSDCDKYNYSKTEQIPWSGISNNPTVKEDCISK